MLYKNSDQMDAMFVLTVGTYTRIFIILPFFKKTLKKLNFHTKYYIKGEKEKE